MIESKSMLRQLEDWLTSAPNREVRIEFNRLGFQCRLTEGSRDGKQYFGGQIERTVDSALREGLENWRTHVETLMVSETDGNA